jgi:AraC-like DNA-binding protein
VGIGVPHFNEGLLDRIRLARIHDINELESGAFWQQLQPYFIKPYFRRLAYQIAGRVTEGPKRQVLTTRGAIGLGDLDIGYVGDHRATVMTITDAGIPDYCLTVVARGASEYLSNGRAAPISATPAIGLIYRGLAGTRVRSAEGHARLAIRIPSHSLERRLTALMGGPMKGDLTFAPSIDWRSAPGQSIARLIWLMTEELASPASFAGNGIARQSFEDLLLYSLLQSLPHSHSDQLGRATASPVPRIIRRAEEFIRSRAGQPMALHEVAEAAGCSVRALQLGFRRFRETTPAVIIRQIRLEAVRQALTSGDATGTVTNVALQFGFTNPGRFTRLYKETFGMSPADALRCKASPP